MYDKLTYYRETKNNHLSIYGFLQKEYFDMKHGFTRESEAGKGISEQLYVKNMK